MHRTYKKLLASCLVLAILFSQLFFGSTAFAAKAEKYRLYGDDRIKTAIEISKLGWPGSSQYAVLVTAYNFPDALCAAPLAKRFDAPILLTESNALNPDVKAELLRLKVKNVIIVGGPGVVSDAVLNSVKSIANVERIYGDDRELTSIEVAKRLGTSGQVVLATGIDFPDALSVSSIAGAKGMPILLMATKTLSPAMENYLKNNGITTTYVVGDTAAIGTSIDAKVPGAVRIGGANKVQTNYEVMRRFASDFDFSTVFIATAKDFPDALAGSALAAMTVSPIVLADGMVLENTKKLIKESVDNTCGIIALGGPAIVGDSVVDDVISTINSGIPAGDLRVESVSTNGLNQIKVVYTKKVDKVSAETLFNYRVGDVYLSSSDRAALQSDGRTVIITLDNPAAQQEKRIFMVNENAIRSDDNLSTVPKYQTEISFFDVTSPAVKGVTPTGNKVLTVEFTEALKIPAEFINGLGLLFRLDGQYLVNYGYSNAVAVNPTTVNAYTDRLELRFNAGISAGNHVLTIPESASNYLVDKAGFRVGGTDINFKIDTVSNNPRIIDVTGEDNGIVYVTYDRAMDPYTAENPSYYNVFNNYPLSAGFKSGSDSKIVKLVFASNVVLKGDNILVVNKAVKDIYGNTLDPDNDIRLVFKATGDNTKPTVQSVSVIDSTHIRVRFSEVVDYQYAMNAGNYTLQDIYGQTLNYISSVTRDSGLQYGDTYIINLNTPLTGSNYTLKIRNIVDLGVTPNIMDDYTTSLTWQDNQAPWITEEVVPDGSSTKIIVYFSEPMDRASITNRSNLYYKDGDNNVRELPYSTLVEAAPDNKSITVTFSGAYRVKTSGWSGITDVKGIVVSGAKDTAGNILASITDYKDVVPGSSAQNRPTYVENTFKLYSDSDKVWAEFELSQPLSTIFITDFRVAGVMPDAGYITNTKVSLVFVDSDKKDAVKRAGKSAQLYTVSTSSANAGGAYMNSISNKTVFDDRIAPELVRIEAYNNLSGEDLIKFKFTEAIDDTIAGSYKDDFRVLGGGTAIEANYVTVSDEYVIFHYGSGTFNTGDRIIVNAIPSNINIRDMRDLYGDQNMYVPRTSEISGINTTAQ